MLAGLETGIGLDVVVWLQAQSHPALDALVWAIHVLGAPAAYLLLLPLWSRRITGSPEMMYQWVFTLVVTILFTDALKLLFHAPRPYQAAPEVVRLLVVQRSNHGFPSGHVSAALAMSGLGAVWGGRRWLWVVAALYTLVVGWSRMYAGVHYPQDVIGGAAVGLLTLWFSLRYFERFMAIWRRIPLLLRAALVVAGVVLVVNVPGI